MLLDFHFMRYNLGLHLHKTEISTLMNNWIYL